MCMEWEVVLVATDKEKTRLLSEFQKCCHQVTT